MPDREGERLIGQQVGHHGATDQRHTGQVRRECRGIQQMPRVQETGEEHDARPGQAAGDVADSRELGRTAEHDDAHRQHFDRGEAGFPGREAVDEPEADRRDGDARGIDEHASATCGECLSGRAGPASGGS